MDSKYVSIFFNEPVSFPEQLPSNKGMKEKKQILESQIFRVSICFLNDETNYLIEIAWLYTQVHVL